MNNTSGAHNANTVPARTRQVHNRRVGAELLQADGAALGKAVVVEGLRVEGHLCARVRLKLRTESPPKNNMKSSAAAGAM